MHKNLGSNVNADEIVRGLSLYKVCTAVNGEGDI
jgi:hypothetical protein